jgi:hypothetical protein
MPRNPIDYANTIIYKIVCKNLSITDMYVGHTTSFTHRKREHKSRCINNFTFPIYKTINDNNGWENWEMIEIEKYPCKDVNEAKARERHWYETLTATLNARSPTLNVEMKREREKNYHKIYNENNYEELTEQKRLYRIANKEKLNEQKRTYYEANKEKYKLYRLQNKDKIKEQNRLYRLAHKED